MSTARYHTVYGTRVRYTPIQKVLADPKVLRRSLAATLVIWLPFALTTSCSLLGILSTRVQVVSVLLLPPSPAGVLVLLDQRELFGVHLRKLSLKRPHRYNKGVPEHCGNYTVVINASEGSLTEDHSKT